MQLEGMLSARSNIERAIQEQLSSRLLSQREEKKKEEDELLVDINIKTVPEDVTDRLAEFIELEKQA